MGVFRSSGAIRSEPRPPPRSIGVFALRSVNDDNDADDFGSTIFVGGDADGILIQRNILRNPGFSGMPWEAHA